MGRERQAGFLTAKDYDELNKAWDEREASILARPTAVPEATSVATGKTVDVELPAEDASADPWDSATPVRPQAAEVTKGEPADFSPAYHLLFASIWKGGFESQLAGEIDGNAERGEIDASEAAALRAMLADRPGYPDSFVRLMWRAELAPDETALDTLKDYANHLTERSEEPLTAGDHRKVMAAVAARRIELKKIPA